MKASFTYRKSHSEIKRVNRKEEVNHFIRRQMVDKAKRNADKQDKYQAATSPEVQATNQAVTLAKEASFKAYYTSKKHIQRRTHDLMNHRKNRQFNTNNKQSNTDINQTSIHSKINGFKEKNSSYKNIQNSSYEGMKQYVIDKVKNQSKYINATFISRVKDAFVNASKTIAKKIVTPGNQWIVCGGICLLLAFSLIFSAVSSLSLDSYVISAQEMLSEEVLAYEETIIKYAKEYGIEEYVPIIEAIMMQESQGKGKDPMQASECSYNTKYPDGITDPEYSIKVGIKYYADCIKKANVKDVNDDKGIALSLQGYNYGTGYIEWAIQNFQGFTLANSKVYSDMKKDELNINTYGDINYVNHVLRYVSLGFGNLRSNPNFNNLEAWVSRNPYAQAGLYGQCTWFAWGRFYEIYGYSPGFTGNGWDCVDQLVAAHPDKFKKSNKPSVGAIFSTLGHNHVGIVIGFDGTNITIQEGNLDGYSNTFAQAKRDWHTATYTLNEFISMNGGVVFANKKVNK